MSSSKAAKSRLSALVVIRALLGASFLARSAIATSSRPTAPLIPSTTCSTRPRSPSHRADISSRIPRFSKRPAWSNWSAREAMASSSSTFSSSRPAACRTDSNRRCSRRRLESVRQAAVVREHVAYRGCLVLLEVCHKPKTFQVEPDFSRLKSSTLDLSYAKDVAGDTPAPARAFPPRPPSPCPFAASLTSFGPSAQAPTGGTSPLRTTPKRG